MMLTLLHQPKVAATPAHHIQLQRKCACGSKADSQEESGQVLQRAGLSSSAPPIVPPIVHQVLDAPGQPLDADLRAFLEPGFGMDFSAVRVHADGRAAQSAQVVSALAYTVGQDVVFGAGQYRPATESGRQLIAHELAHVLQQGGGPIPRQLDLDSAAGPLERQADLLGREALASGETREKQRAPQMATGRRDGTPGTARSGTGSNQLSTPPTLETRRPPTSKTNFRNTAAKGQIQRRRVPSDTGLAAALPTDPAGFANAQAGVARALSRAWAGLTAAQQTAVRTATTGLGITWVTEAQLLTQLNSASRADLMSFAQAIRTAAPAAELGDPALIDIGARPGTTDAANIATVVKNANAVFTTIAGGTRDTDIGQVFGTANIATAKKKYDNARTSMNALKAADKIVTDRSGYNIEVGLGGLTNSAQIMVMSSVIDNPNEKESVATLIHESMHAGNNDVRDFGYIHQPSFTVLAEAVKLTNAAHFEVVARRILKAANAFPGVTFIPAGTAVGGVSAPALTPREQAIRGASEMFRFAWTAGLNLHTLFVRLFRTPAEWNTLDLSTRFTGAPAGVHFADTLPFWSKVEMLTIHTRAASINPAGVPAVRPVTLIDIALSEGVTRKMSQGMNNVPQTEADALAFETAHTAPAALAAAVASVNGERDLLIELVILVKLGSITGPVSRDERVVARLAQAAQASDFTDYLTARPPSAFP